jgi:hypothetical protein
VTTTNTATSLAPDGSDVQVITAFNFQTWAEDGDEVATFDPLHAELRERVAIRSFADDRAVLDLPMPSPRGSVIALDRCYAEPRR